MTRFWWVRHGPTHEKRFVGWRDVAADLSDLGAIDRLNQYLPCPAFLVSSDLSRSVATADALGNGRQRLPDDGNLREFNFGRWDGRDFSQVAESDPDLSRLFWEAPGDICAPDGESWNDVDRRVEKSVAELRQTHVDQDIVIVAHIGVILTQVARALSVTPAQALSHRIDNLSVTRIDLGPPSNAVCINHLP